MKNLTLFFTSLLFSQPFTSMAQTTIGGVFFNNTLITLSNSPYHVTSNILVPHGVTVRVEPGVVFFNDSGILWQIEGEFQAQGTLNDSITFQLQANSTGEWQGFLFNSSAVPYNSATDSGCILNYCKISNSQQPIWINDISVYILHTDIKGGWGIVAYCSGAVIKHTRIHDGEYIAITTYLPAIFPQPVIIDSCEIFNYVTGLGDIIRVNHAYLTNSCIHNITTTENGVVGAAVTVWDGPDSKVENNNIYDNGVTGLLILDSPDTTVRIIGNNFSNNRINLGTTSCYKLPIIRQNNFNSFTSYNVYCKDDTWGVSNVFGYCNAIPNMNSYFTLDITQNYFGGLTAAQIDSSIYDLYDNFIGRTIIAYDTNIASPYSNPLDCSHLFNPEITGISLLNEDKSFSIFPNPASGEFNIALNKFYQEVTLSVYDVVGKKIFERDYKNVSGTLTINLSGNDNGIFYVTLQSGKDKLTGKLCVLNSR